MTQLHIVADFLLFWRQIQNFVVDELKKFYEPRKYHLYQKIGLLKEFSISQGGPLLLRLRDIWTPDI